MKNAFLCLVIIMLAGCFGIEPEKTGMEGKPLPSFKLFLADSVTYLDTKDIPSGKPVVLLYFGPHCPYSKVVIEDIVKNMESLKDIRFYVFTTWSFKELKTFYADYGLVKFPNIIAGVDYTNFFSEYFSIDGVPYIAIYGIDKRLKEAFLGKVKSSQIRSVAMN